MDHGCCQFSSRNCTQNHLLILAARDVPFFEEPHVQLRTYLPDMPKEYFRMPYSQAKSDIIRCGQCRLSFNKKW